MLGRYWLLGLLAILASAFFWFDLDALAYLVGAVMVAYTYHAKV